MARIKNNNRLLIYSLLAGFIAFFIKLFLRPLVIKQGFNDYGFHEFSPNLFYTIGMCLFAAFWVKKRIKTIIFVTVGILAYEIEQIWTSMTFDYLDIIAIIVGFGISVLIVTKHTRVADYNKLVA